MYFNDDTIIFLDGNYVKATQSSTGLYSQTLHYGYGVFEGIRSYNHERGPRIFKAKEHYDRLKRSCEQVNIPLNYATNELIDYTYEVLRRNSLSDAYIRPLVFCSPNMGLTRPIQVSLMIAAWNWGAYLGKEQIRVTISSYCRPHPRSIAIDAKVCGHYVNSILAASEAKEKGYDEALLLDCEGYLAEGPGANLFFEKDGILFTPQPGHILPGITRDTVFELAMKMNIEVRQGRYQVSDLINADTAFYCGTAAEIVGIQSVNEFRFPLPWNQSAGCKLQEAYSQLVRDAALVDNE